MSEHRRPRQHHLISEAEPCPTCLRAQRTIDRFLKDGDYWKVAESFIWLRADDPSGTQHLDRWQADAALIAQEWDAAWKFRALGLLESNRRMTLEDIINVRARCRERWLSAEDLHLFVLSDSGLTPWGKEHLRQVNAVADAVLMGTNRTQNTNPLQALYERYTGRTPTDDDFAEVADECDDLVSVDLLRRHMEGETYAIEQYRQWAEASTSKGVNVEQQLYEWYTAPKKWCFQPTQGRFVKSHGRDHPRFGYIRAPSWMSVAAEALCRALLRRCENDVRIEACLPEIGGGWVSETELFRLVAEVFADTPVVQHAQPQWLRPQHLDVYLPAHNVALEYQGRQHFEAIDFFGGEEGLRKRRERDARKRRLCRKNGCSLVEVKVGYEPNEVINQVRAALAGGN